MRWHFMSFNRCIDSSVMESISPIEKSGALRCSSNSCLAANLNHSFAPPSTNTRIVARIMEFTVFKKKLYTNLKKNRDSTTNDQIIIHKISVSKPLFHNRWKYSGANKIGRFKSTRAYFVSDCSMFKMSRASHFTKFSTSIWDKK